MKTQTTEKQHELTDKEYAAYCAPHNKELDANHKVLRKQMNALYKKHPEKYALMKNGKILEIFDNRDDAVAEGNKRFEDRIFSALKIRIDVIDLGIFSRI